MRKNFTLLFIVPVFHVISLNVAAQNDSLLDLGRVQIRKDLTQTITIKARDLEQIPFATITDAIAPWLQGSLSSLENLVFVVDGNLAADVNILSIHDIEEITLVQNALGQLNGAEREQQLVLIKTKRNAAKHGLLVAGSSFIVKNHNTGFESQTNFYHQYQVSAWQNRDKVQFGVAANFLRDVYPGVKAGYVKTSEPNHVTRYRFNGWLNASLAEGHSVSLRLNFVPQSNGYDNTLIFAEGSTSNFKKEKQSLLYPSLRLSNRIAKGLTNEIDISFLSSRVNSEALHTRTIFTPLITNTRNITEGVTKTNNLLIRENIAYSTQLGNWEIRPAVNFMYRSLKMKYHFQFSDFQNNVPPNIVQSFSRRENEYYVLTPSFSLSHRNSFYFIGGITASLKDDKWMVPDGIFPFASVSLDLLRIGNPDNTSALKIFGSYAKSNILGDQYFTMPDAKPESDPIRSDFVFGFFSILPITLYQEYPGNDDGRSIQAGTSFSTKKDKLQISYNFSNRRYLDVMIFPEPAGSGVTYTLGWKYFNFNSHRLGITAPIIDKPGLQWLMGVNVNTYKFEAKDMERSIQTGIETVSNNDKPNWTGGWTNRLQCGHFVFGLDFLYLLHEYRRFVYTPIEFQKFDNWRFNNIYAGYRMQVAQSKPLELYLSVRNLAQNENPYFDNRKYYGLGFRLQL